VDGSGGLLASAGADRSARVWDADGFFCTHVFHGHQCAGPGSRCPSQALNSADQHLHWASGCRKALQHVGMTEEAAVLTKTSRAF